MQRTLSFYSPVFTEDRRLAFTVRTLRICTGLRCIDVIVIQEPACLIVHKNKNSGKEDCGKRENPDTYQNPHLFPALLFGTTHWGCGHPATHLHLSMLHCLFRGGVVSVLSSSSMVMHRVSTLLWVVEDMKRLMSTLHMLLCGGF